MFSLKRMDPLLDSVTTFAIPELPNNRLYKYHNALMISQAGDPFWLRCADSALEIFNSGKRRRVEAIAGPMRLQALINSERPQFTAPTTQRCNSN